MTMTYFVIALALVLGAFFYFKGKSRPSTYNSLSVSALDQFMNDGNIILIDVRTQKEINQGVIGIPLQIELGPALPKKMNALDKEKKYIVYCRSGRRSAIASDMMVNIGFKDVYNLVGGYMAWSQN